MDGRPAPPQRSRQASCPNGRAVGVQHSTGLKHAAGPGAATGAFSPLPTTFPAATDSSIFSVVDRISRRCAGRVKHLLAGAASFDLTSSGYWKTSHQPSVVEPLFCQCLVSWPKSSSSPPIQPASLWRPAVLRRVQSDGALYDRRRRHRQCGCSACSTQDPLQSGNADDAGAGAVEMLVRRATEAGLTLRTAALDRFHISSTELELLSFVPVSRILQKVVSASSDQSSQLVPDVIFVYRPLTVDGNVPPRHVQGTLMLTRRSVQFMSHDKRAAAVECLRIYTSIIQSAKKLPGSRLLIQCKTFHEYLFIIHSDVRIDNVVRQIDIDRAVDSFDDIFALAPFDGWTPAHERLFGGPLNITDSIEARQNSWMPLWEMDVNRFNTSETWIESNFNHSYEQCQTYPELLILPRDARTNVLRGSAANRSKCRLPACTYLYEYDTKQKRFAAICRSAQPLGFTPTSEDVQLLAVIRNTNFNEKLHLLDLRTFVSAHGNFLRGGGQEMGIHYDGAIKLQNCNIGNIHDMRSSLKSLLEGARAERDLGRLMANTTKGVAGWLNHLKSIIAAACKIRDLALQGESTLSHCSDGWDRTSQVCALAALMLDPFYRTPFGFPMLVYRDFLAFGHKFQERCAHFNNGNRSQEVSPVFVQFIDCVWQLKQQCPGAFQFNEFFLLTLIDAAYDCRFGDFLGSCEKDRKDLKVQERTYSLWGIIRQDPIPFSEPDWSPQLAQDQQVLRGSFVDGLRIWATLYQRADELHTIARSQVNPVGADSANKLSSRLKREVQSVSDFRSLVGGSGSGPGPGAGAARVSPLPFHARSVQESRTLRPGFSGLHAECSNTVSQKEAYGQLASSQSMQVIEAGPAEVQPASAVAISTGPGRAPAVRFERVHDESH